MEKEKANETKPNLTKRQQRALPFVAFGRTIAEGCKQAGISKVTFYEWMKQEHFREALTSEQNNLFNSALKELKVLSSEAVETLGVLARESPSETIRLKAISLILEYIFKLKEIEDVQEIVKALQEKLDKIEHANKW